MADLQCTDQEPCHPPSHHRRRSSRIMDKIFTSITCIPKRSRKKRKKHEGEAPLPPIPTEARQDMKGYESSEARYLKDEEEMSETCQSDMTMSPFSDIFARSMSVTESAESTSSRSASSISKPTTTPSSPETVRLRKAARACMETPETMSEATTESEGESEISSYYVSSPFSSTDLGQPKTGTVRKYGSVLAVVSLVASLVRLMIYGETCVLLLTSSIAFLVILWSPVVKNLMPMWNKERYRMKAERRLARYEMQGSNASARMANVKLNHRG